MTQGATADYGMVRYRWVVLAVTMAANAVIQMLWISYAAVSGRAADYFGVSETAVGIFSMSFMLAFIPLSIPAAALIDRRGVRLAVGLGCVLAAVGGVARGLAGPSYAVALAGTVLIAVAQPLLLNSWATIASAWFDRNSRATASGLITLSNLLGTAVGMAATPAAASALGVNGMQLLYGVLMAVSAIAFVVWVRDHPVRPPDQDATQERALVTDGLRHALSVRPFWKLLAGVFVLMGTFNGVMTWVEQIVEPRGFSEDDAGLFGAVTLVVGIVGALVLSSLSDKRRRRIPYLAIAAGGAIPGLLGIAFAPTVPLLMLAGCIFGFFLTGGLPVAIEYAAELTRPTPEGTSNGLVQLAGQSSVVMVYLMDAQRGITGSLTPSLVVLAGCLAIGLVVLRSMPEPHDYLQSHGLEAPDAGAVIEA